MDFTAKFPGCTLSNEEIRQTIKNIVANDVYVHCDTCLKSWGSFYNIRYEEGMSCKRCGIYKCAECPHTCAPNPERDEYERKLAEGEITALELWITIQKEQQSARMKAICEKEKQQRMVDSLADRKKNIIERIHTLNPTEKADVTMSMMQLQTILANLSEEEDLSD